MSPLHAKQVEKISTMTADQLAERIADFVNDNAVGHVHHVSTCVIPTDFPNIDMWTAFIVWSKA